MFKLHDIRKTKVWQEACEETREEEHKKFVDNCLAKDMPYKEIAALMQIPVEEVRRLAKHS